MARAEEEVVVWFLKAACWDGRGAVGRLGWGEGEGDLLRRWV